MDPGVYLAKRIGGPRGLLSEILGFRICGPQSHHSEISRSRFNLGWVDPGVNVVK